MKNPKVKTYRKCLLKPVNGSPFPFPFQLEWTPLAALNYCAECLLTRLSNLVCMKDWETVSPDTCIPGGKWYYSVERYPNAPHQLLAKS